MTLNELMGIPVVSDSLLVGSKTAILKDGKLVVSPAMLDLMRHANEAEMDALMHSIRLLDLDRIFGRQWPLQSIPISFEPKSIPEPSFMDMFRMYQITKVPNQR